MRLSLGLLALLALPAPALAQELQDPTQQPPAPERPTDDNHVRREALLDLGFNALAGGNLELAESAFADAASLPGDPAQSAMAASLLERVRHLRARRRAPSDATVHGTLAPRPAPSSGYTERISLLGTTTALGLGLYGWTLPGALGVSANDSPRGFVGLYMLTAAGSFIGPYLLLRDEPVTPGQANLAFYGGTRGIWDGLLVGALMAGELGPDTRYRGWTASMLVGSVGGLVGGYQLARAAELTAGQARTMAAVGDFGLGFGFGTGFLLRFDSPPVPCEDIGFGPCLNVDPQADAHARKMATMGLLGSGLGLWGGYLLAKHRDNTWGDGEVLRASIALGAWTAFGVADFARTDIQLHNRAFTGALMAGGTAGLLLGDRLVRHTDFTPGQSILIDLSLLSGGLLGAGIARLLPGDEENKRYVAASAFGALGGFALSYWGFHDSPEGPAARRLSRVSGRGVTVLPTAGAQGQRGVALAGLF